MHPWKLVAAIIWLVSHPKWKLGTADKTSDWGTTIESERIEVQSCRICGWVLYLLSNNGWWWYLVCWQQEQWSLNYVNKAVWCATGELPTGPPICPFLIGPERTLSSSLTIHHCSCLWVHANNVIIGSRYKIFTTIAATTLCPELYSDDNSDQHIHLLRQFHNHLSWYTPPKYPPCNTPINNKTPPKTTFQNNCSGRHNCNNGCGCLDTDKEQVTKSGGKKFTGNYLQTWWFFLLLG